MASPVLPTDLPPLTDRQLDCMALVAEGMTSKQIAKKLGISPRTVDQHVAAVLDTLQVKNRIAAVQRLRDLEAASASAQDDSLFFVAPSEANEQNLIASPEASENAASEAVKSPVFPPVGGRENHASSRRRIFWMGNITGLSIMVSCVMILVILGLTEVARVMP